LNSAQDITIKPYVRKYALQTTNTSQPLLADANHAGGPQKRHEGDKKKERENASMIGNHQEVPFHCAASK
jgi:hypothetical protein